MRAKFGTFLMVLGVALLLASVLLLCHNSQEERDAYVQAEAIMPEIVASIRQNQEQNRSDPERQENDTPLVPAVGFDDTVREMTVSVIDGNGYIGFISIPELSIELPIMADWSYEKLRIAPCRYTGNLFEDDLVLMAHNYKTHFGTLKDLRIGDMVIFTDMDGTKYTYHVMAVDILSPTAIEEMTAGEYDLTLFTCTYGGQSRVTIRCDRFEE